jgi:hypothetical protein
MDHICVAFPVLPGKTAEARAFFQELDGPKKSAFDRSERRIGITKELWFVAESPAGDQLLGYMEAADFNSAFGAFVQSRDEFDMWFKSRLAAVTGLDLNNPPADFKPPQLVSHYDVTHMANV